jgi:hypothetical protein
MTQTTGTVRNVEGHPIRECHGACGSTAAKEEVVLCYGTPHQRRARDRRSVRTLHELKGHVLAAARDDEC